MTAPSAQFTLMSTQVKDVPKNYLSLRFLAFALLLGAGLSASATTITLNFNTLPSTQGWTYDSSGIAEGSVFSVNGSTLTQNTIGDGYGAYADYQMAGQLDPTKPFSIDVTVRILGEEFGTPGAFGFAGLGTNLYSLVFVGESAVRVLVPGSAYQQIPIDGTLFHDYLFRVNPGAGTWILDIDGVFAMTGPLETSFNLANHIYFGDPSTGQNGDAEIAKYVFTQNSTVPEPTSLSLIGIGLIGVVRRLRRT